MLYMLSLEGCGRGEKRKELQQELRVWRQSMNVKWQMSFVSNDM